MMLPGTARRKMTGCLACLLIATVLLGVSAFAKQAEAEPIRVGTAAMLQEAIEDAPEGAVIQLEPGVYVGPVHIEKSLTLRGSPDDPAQTSLSSDTDYYQILYITGDETTHVVIEGLAIDGDGANSHGLRIAGQARVTCHAIQVRDCERNGIWHDGTGRLVITDSTFERNYLAGIRVGQETTASAGSGNSFMGNGVDLAGAANPELRSPLAVQTDSVLIHVPADYATLQEAIDAAPPHATIQLGEGRYDAAVVLWKPVHLTGRGQVKTHLAPREGRDLVLSILASAGNTLIEDLGVTGRQGASLEVDHGRVHLRAVTFSPGRSYSYPLLTAGNTAHLIAEACAFHGESLASAAAVSVEEHATLVLANCDVRSTLTACTARDQAKLQINGCRFGASEFKCIEVYDQATVHANYSIFESSALHAFGGETTLYRCMLEKGAVKHVHAESNACVQVSDCQILGATFCGVAAYDDSVVDLQDSLVTGCGSAAISGEDRSSLTVTGCEIIDNPSIGVLLEGKAVIELRDSLVSGSGNSGIVAWGRSSWALIGCEIRDAPTACIASDRSKLQVSSCRFDASEFGCVSVSDRATIRVDASVFESPALRALGGETSLHGCTLHAGAETHIYAMSDAHLRVHDCRLLGASFCGIDANDDTVVNLRDSLVTGCEFAALCGDDSSTLTVTGCEIIDNPGDGIFLSGDAVFELHDSLVSGCGKGGIYGGTKSTLTVTGCEIIDNPGSGVFLSSRAGATIRDSRINSNGHGGFVREDGTVSPLPGLVMIGSMSLVLSDCSVSSNAAEGIQSYWYLGKAEDGEAMSLSLTNCDLQKNGGSGLEALGLDAVSLVRCHVAGNDGNGIELSGVGQSVIADCVIENSAGSGLVGGGSGDLSVEHSSFLSNKHGLVLGGSGAIKLSECTIQDNTATGVLLYSASCIDSDYIERSRFTGNLTGSGNWIPDSKDPAGNGSIVCPESWIRMLPSGFFRDTAPEE